jgi:hypothetical protein
MSFSIIRSLLGDGRFPDSPRHEMPQELFDLCLQRFDRYDSAIGASPYGDRDAIVYERFMDEVSDFENDPFMPYNDTVARIPRRRVERRWISLQHWSNGWRWVPDHEGDRAAVEAELERRGEGRVLQINPGYRLEYSFVDHFIERSKPPHTTPIACQGCKHYHGAVYNGVPFVCAMHPYGADGDECGDRQCE